MLKKYIKELVSGKKILIMGFGREGRSTYRLIKEVGGFAELAVSDMNSVSDIGEKVFSGSDYQAAAKDYDIVFKSPGVVLEDFSLKDKVISQTDCIMNCFRDRMIGITGTKGKSTTTTLIYHILKCCGKNPVLMGNIGIPAFDAAEELDENNLIVYELSCHQLEFAVSSPHTGVLLNIYPEHLDHYGTFEKYRDAKENIYKNMKKGDFLVCASECVPLSSDADILSVSMDDKSAGCFVDEVSHFADEEINFADYTKSLFGKHNMYNISVAYSVCRRVGAEKDEILSAIESFKGLSHRLELFAEINGVRYFDDSISTIPETAVRALSSIENVGTVILGGMDRGVELDFLVEYLIKNPVNNIILMPDTGKKIYELLNGKTESALYMTSGLAEATAIAKSITKPGEACLLSPAAASYGFFKNFEERGDEFKRLVLAECIEQSGFAATAPLS